MVTVHSDNSDYIKWIYRNPGAYIINLDTNGKFQSMVHTARCMHLYEPDPAYDHVSTYRKASADSLGELVAWAKDLGHSVAECTTCLPYDQANLRR